jgi:hypothetical protein
VPPPPPPPPDSSAGSSQATISAIAPAIIHHPARFFANIRSPPLIRCRSSLSIAGAESPGSVPRYRITMTVAAPVGWRNGPANRRSLARPGGLRRTRGPLGRGASRRRARGGKIRTRFQDRREEVVAPKRSTAQRDRQDHSDRHRRSNGLTPNERCRPVLRGPYYGSKTASGGNAFLDRYAHGRMLR